MDRYLGFDILEYEKRKLSVEKSKVSLDNVTALIEKYAALNTKDSTYYTYEMLDEFYKANQNRYLELFYRKIKDYADDLSGIVVASGFPFISTVSRKIAREIVFFRRKNILKEYFAEEALHEILRLENPTPIDIQAIHSKYKYFTESFENNKLLFQFIFNL